MIALLMALTLGPAVSVSDPPPPEPESAPVLMCIEEEDLDSIENELAEGMRWIIFMLDEMIN